MANMHLFVCTAIHSSLMKKFICLGFRSSNMTDSIIILRYPYITDDIHMIKHK